MYQEGKIEEVRSLLGEALKGARTDHARGRILLKKARSLELSGWFEDAIEVLRQAEPLIDARREPRLLCVLHFNRAVSYCNLDRYHDAAALLPLIEVMAEDLRTELDSVRLRWLTGRTQAGLGRREEAIAALFQVREHFEKEQIPYDFALVSLELAVLHLEQGRTQRVRELADGMLWIFRDQRIHKEALAAISLFCQSARLDAADAEWTRRLIKYLYLAQHNPTLRFEE